MAPATAPAQPAVPPQVGRVVESVDERFERCYCTGVTREQAVAAIQAGARSVEDLQRTCGACTGCGTCRWELEGLLKEMAAGKAPPA